jgi:O-methyltransferase domain/Dimerisation domain
MSSQLTPARSKPKTDDRPIWDLIFSFWAIPSVLVAHDLKLFTLLGERPRTLKEVCASLGAPERSTRVLLQTNVNFGLIAERHGRYKLTRVAAEYLDERSPINLGGYLNFLVANHGLWSVASLKKAVLTNSPQAGGGKDFFSDPEMQKAFARVFTKAMYAHSIGSALVWPDKVDLSKHRRLLDIGGGSGAQTVGALLRWRKLTGIVLDTPPVIAEAPQYVDPYNLGDRIMLHAADMFTDPFPKADVHLYGDILHDWPRDKGALLVRKSFDSLPSGGMIILREILSNDGKSGPLAAIAYDVDMLLVTMGGQYSKREMTALLKGSGFRSIQIGPAAAGCRNLITARKA